MSMLLQARVTALEARVKQQDEVISGLIEAMTQMAEAPAPNAKGPRQLCPKCHEKPNYFLHVRSCKGPSKQAAAI